MSLTDVVSASLLLAGSIFFLAGTVGLLRFRDVHSRLHALSKADNLGLGLISIALMIKSESLSTAIKIFLIWVLALLASAATCYAIAEWEMGNDKPD